MLAASCRPPKELPAIELIVDVLEATVVVAGFVVASHLTTHLRTACSSGLTVVAVESVVISSVVISANLRVALHVIIFPPRGVFGIPIVSVNLK